MLKLNNPTCVFAKPSNVFVFKTYFTVQIKLAPEMLQAVYCTTANRHFKVPGTSNETGGDKFSDEYCVQDNFNASSNENHI